LSDKAIIVNGRLVHRRASMRKQGIRTSLGLVLGEDVAVLVKDGGVAERVSLVELPSVFLQWQLASRGVLFMQHMAQGDRVARFQAHLPVLVTVSTDGAFPFHTANKGTGLLPQEQHLARDTAGLRSLLEQSRQRGWRESLRERVAFMSTLYADPDHWDPRCLGSLEIFQGTSYRNIQGDPRVTLHYTGTPPDYPSFQVNALAQVIGPESPHYEYLYWARQLFEYDSFHIQQPAYPAGYLFWPCEVFDKSPSGQAGQRIA